MSFFKSVLTSVVRPIGPIAPINPMKRIGILISGRGSNMLALIRAVADGRIHEAEVAVVISNVANAAGLERAREEHDRAMAAELRAREVDLVCLAGYMRLLSPWFTREFEGRVLNIHPSLLPDLPGLNAQRQAIEYGVKFSGCTVHMVDEELDHGPIVKQAVVPVWPVDTEETLSAKILTEEHRIYSDAVALVLSGRFRVEGRRVIEW